MVSSVFWVGISECNLQALVGYSIAYFACYSVSPSI